MHYEGTLEDGTVFDCSYKRGPLPFVLGELGKIPHAPSQACDCVLDRLG
jgi:FKBP-type peptidyl-prolyl cis-trans isomerase 2